MDIIKRHLNRQQERKSQLGDEYKENGVINSRLDGSLIDPRNFSKTFSRLLDKNGLKHIRYHDLRYPNLNKSKRSDFLRHTNASLMLKQGIPMKVASDRLGHTTIGITMDLYTHTDDDLQQDAAQKLNDIIAI